MNAVLSWIKANIFIVVFLVLMVVALATLPIVSARINAGIKKDVEDRVSKASDLASLTKTSVDIPRGGGQPPMTETTLVNARTLEKIRQVNEKLNEDAAQVYDEALAYNQAGRTVLLDNIFPEPPDRLREVLPQQFHEKLVQAVDDLLKEVKAGAPPSPEKLAEDIQRRHAQFLTSTLARESTDNLTDEEQKLLTESLTSARLQYCSDKAGVIGFYGSTRELVDLPSWDAARVPTLPELYEWQWMFWIYQDVLRALHAANTDAESVLDAPVKRLVSLAILEDSAEVVESGGGGGSRGGNAPGPGAGMGASGGGGGGRARTPAPTGEVVRGDPVLPDPKKEAKIDYVASITGRMPNQLYDVRYVAIEILVETERIPEVLDTINRQNFISIIDLQLTSADPYTDLADGYYYGGGALSSISMTLETIWFRQWTAPFMPYETRQAKGIKTKKPKSPDKG